MMQVVQIILCILLFVAWIKNKLALHVASLWMAENDVQTPTNDDIRRLTSKLVRHWFHQG